jgi:hypothetical protein
MSTPFILSSPPVAPPVPEQQWQGLSLLWEGRDGSVWNLNDVDGGVVLRREGVEGLHFPRITKFKSRSRAVPGSRTRGWQAETRDAFWPIYLWADGTRAWLERHDEFFSTIHPEDPGTWIVRAGDRTRRLPLTGVFDSPHVFDRDPAIRGWALFPVPLEADEPYWQGEPITAGPWRGSDPVDFFPEGGGPPFHISESATFGTAVMENDGDVAAWPVWDAAGTNGALDNIVFGVGGSLITVPFPVAEGDMLRINTDPRRPTAKLGPIPEAGQAFVPTTDVTRPLGLQSYSPIPPGSAVSVTVAAVGPGTITGRITPLYFRAF